MSDAWSNAMYNVNFGALPKHINMAQRDRLGWVDAARKLVIPAGDLARTTVQLDFAHLAGAANPPMIVLAMQPRPDPYATVFYTLEARRRTGRSEEHTSELHSLMRHSYAVFCLQKHKHIHL